MKPSRELECPRTEQLSALIDGELSAQARNETEAHARICPLCGRMLEDLKELRIGLQPLAQLPATPDLLPLIEQRLSAGKPAARAKPDGKSWFGWHLVPAGLGAAATLSAGIYMGAVLVGGTAVSTAQPAMMAMFDAIPPGGVCLGLQSCNGRGR